MMSDGSTPAALATARGFAELGAQLAGRERVGED
jgi:hypothetical protein